MIDEKYVKDMERRAADSIKVEQGDYEIDGLLHCHICHTPKQTRVEIFGKVRKPMCLCKCGAERREKELEASRASEMEYFSGEPAYLTSSLPALCGLWRCPSAT